jgi:hypothetical protein
MPEPTKTITEEQYRLLVMAAAQTDYANHAGDWDCLEAAGHNAALALKALGQKTAAEEEEEEEADE